MHKVKARFAPDIGLTTVVLPCSLWANEFTPKKQKLMTYDRQRAIEDVRQVC